MIKNLRYLRNFLVLYLVAFIGSVVTTCCPSLVIAAIVKKHFEGIITEVFNNLLNLIHFHSFRNPFLRLAITKQSKLFMVFLQTPFLQLHG